MVSGVARDMGSAQSGHLQIKTIYDKKRQIFLVSKYIILAPTFIISLIGNGTAYFASAQCGQNSLYATKSGTFQSLPIAVAVLFEVDYFGNSEDWNEATLLFLLYLPYLPSIHKKANGIAILWTGSPH